MKITAAMVKELRERTGAGMMECKKALVECDGDMDGAIEHLRKSGAAQAAKKAGRIAADGMIAMARDEQGRTVLVEVNCETDFVAKEPNFSQFAEAVAATVLVAQPDSVEALLGLPLNGGSGTVEDAQTELVTKVGEKVSIRRFEQFTSAGIVGTYSHGLRIGVAVDLIGADEELAKDLAMHVAASRPQHLSEDDVPAAVIDAEKAILTAQAAESGKPPEIVEKMVAGRIKKYLGEITLLGQPFVKDPDTTVSKLLAARGAQVAHFLRLEVGEGIEKKVENFADEVKAQLKQQ